MKNNTIKIETDGMDTECGSDNWSVLITCKTEENFYEVAAAIKDAGYGEAIGCPWDDTDYENGYGDAISIGKIEVDTKGGWMKEIRNICAKMRKQLK